MRPEEVGGSARPLEKAPSRAFSCQGDSSLRRIVRDEEKYCYARGRHLPMVLFGIVSSALLLAGLYRFGLNEWTWLVAVPFLLINGLYLLLSYSVMLPGNRFRLEDHARLVDKWRSVESGLEVVSVDVFLPVCNEPVETILETWAGVRGLQWPGTLQVYVLDDSDTDALRTAARKHGFHYLRREDRQLRKAGNIRNAFAKSDGDFILLLDADFRPRPDMLMELVPYLLEDPSVGLVQSPQFFDVSPEMCWVQAGAGFVQELFYRLIQPARDRWGAGVCVGSCAVYRRIALEPLGGAPAIDHSEDLWTGFEMLEQGWKLKYVPLVLAKGLCPDRLETFFTQQYRWCQGSLSLMRSWRFWTSSLSLPQKFCYCAGFAYYLATALNLFLTPLPPFIMVCLFPAWVHWNHLAYSILALIYTPFILGWWSVHRFGFHFLTCREISAAAHLNACWDTVRGRMRDWVVTGAQPRKQSRPEGEGAVLCLLGVTGFSCLLIWMGAARAIAWRADCWWHFVPPVLFSTLQMLISWRCLHGRELFRGQQYATQQQTGRRDGVRWGYVASGLIMVMVVGSSTVYLLSSGSNDVGRLQLAAGIHWERKFPADDVAPPFSLRRDADFGRYVVEEAFPEAEARRVIRMREAPQEPGRFFLADFTGKLFLIEQHDSQWQSTLVADLTDGDLGFLYSFEIHPNFPDDPRIFLSYRTRGDDRPLAMRVASLVFDPDRVALPQDEVVLIEQQVDSEEHLAGDLAFDTQGCLVVSCGDNEKSLQDRKSQKLDGGFFSGILRIDVDQRETNLPLAQPERTDRTFAAHYRIPRDNPFLGQPNALEEFWALGLRNPFRMSFDSVTGQLWIGDVGQDRLEQVEVATAGSNHQWSFREGSLPFEKSYLQGKPPVVLHGVSTPPLHEYPHKDLNYCIIGGVVYRGKRFPELHGRYIFGDNRSGRIWSIDPQHPEDRELLLQLPFGKSAMSLVSISTDAAGEIYFTNFVSVPSVYRLSLSTPMQFPERLSETGLFERLSPLTPAASVMAYEVNTPLWSDGMQKQRWIWIPPGQTVDNQGSRWKFPAGTVLIKHFQQPTDAGVTESGTKLTSSRNLETRILVVREDGTSAGVTYLWNEAGTEAFQHPERATLTLSHFAGTFDYQLPGFRDCRVCHNRENPVLGFSEEQLNRSADIAGRLQNQLVHFSRLGVFARPYSLSETESARRLASLDDPRETLERRVRSYLHANCSFCHFENGLEHVKMNLRMFADTPDTDLIGTPAKLFYHRIDGKYARSLIDPARPESSAIYRRLITLDRQYAMPYLGRTLPHQEAAALIREWILSLPRTEEKK